MPQDPTPFEKMRALTKRLLAVPKAEIDRREEEWRKARPKAEKKERKKAA